MAWALLGGAALTFSAVAWFAWAGALGVRVAALLLLSFVLFAMARRRLDPGVRSTIDTVAKVLFTIVGCVALLRHPIELEEGRGSAPLYEAIALYVDQVDRDTFIFYAIVAMLVKFVGVISSAFAWHLLLVGQGIRFPFWRMIMTSFLIGRFIGTFLPSTLGLDGYTLYEAARYSNQPTRAVTAKVLEKFIGITGLFLGMVLTMPFGYSVIVEVTNNVGRPEAAPLLAAAILVVAGGISAVVVIGLVRPALMVWAAGQLTRFAGGPLRRVAEQLYRFIEAVAAYDGKVGLLLLALSAKFVTHFTTFMVYYYTGLAIGVATIEFWPVVFGSSIQVLATVLSPTIAGEGAREAFQALLLSNQYGGAAQAVLAGALGFIAAEAATLWGGAFMWTRTPTWRPEGTVVDGSLADFAWLADDDGGFSAEKVAALQGRKPAG
jgi:hypothetical protein